MSAARERILGRIRRSLGRSEPLAGDALAAVESRLAEPPRGVLPAFQEPLDQRFCDRMEAVAGTVARVTSLAEVPGAVAAHLERNGLPPQALVCPDPLFEGLDWPEGVEVERRRTGGGDPVSVTAAFAGVAETGSLVLLSAQSPTTLNFLPEDHVVVLPESRLLRHLEDAWLRLRESYGDPPRTVNFITGPSKTADVEQTIQVGAHGPRRLHVILVAGA